MNLEERRKVELGRRIGLSVGVTGQCQVNNEVKAMK
jgi:hypothetical protein